MDHPGNITLIAALADRLPDLSGWSRPGCRIDSPVSYTHLTLPTSDLV